LRLRARPEKFPIEILRIVIAEAARRILEQAQRMNASLIERERVNERLQRRPRRARSPCSIHLALNFLVRKIRGADIRENFHAAEVDQQRRGVLDSALAILRDVIGDAPFQHLLKRKIERCRYFRSIRLADEDAFDKMRSDQLSPRPRFGVKHLAFIQGGRPGGSALLRGGEDFVFLSRN